MNEQLQKIRDAIAARAAGKTEEEFERERLQKGVTDAVSKWLADHPNYYEDMAQAPVHGAAPVTDSGMKKRCIKSLGAARLVAKDGTGSATDVVQRTEDSIPADALAKAREAARAFADASPERYANIIY